MNLIPPICKKSVYIDIYFFILFHKFYRQDKGIYTLCENYVISTKIINSQPN